MAVTIPCNKTNFYRYYVELLNPIIKLRNRELDVLAQLMYHNNEHKALPDEIRWKMLFDYSTKVKITKALDISMDVLNNNLTELRKKELVVDNKLKKAFEVYPEGDSHVLSFQFKIKDVTSPANVQSSKMSAKTTRRTPEVDQSS